MTSENNTPQKEFIVNIKNWMTYNQNLIELKEKAIKELTKEDMPSIIEMLIGGYKQDILNYKVNIKLFQMCLKSLEKE